MQAAYRPRKDKTKIEKLDTLFKTKIITKNIPWLAASSHYALITECPTGHTAKALVVVITILTFLKQPFVAGDVVYRIK